MALEGICIVREDQDPLRHTQSEVVTAGGPHYFQRTVKEITEILVQAAKGGG